VDFIMAVTVQQHKIGDSVVVAFTVPVVDSEKLSLGRVQATVDPIRCGETAHRQSAQT